MAQNEMTAMRGMPLRVRSMEGLGGAGNTDLAFALLCATLLGLHDTLMPNFLRIEHVPQRNGRYTKSYHPMQNVQDIAQKPEP
jgi:hypothetical protein